MANGKDLQINLGLDSSDFAAGANRTTRSLEQIQASIRESNAGLKAFQAQLAQASATATAAGQKLDKALGQELRSNIAQAKADVAKFNAELAKADAGGTAGALGGL
jgi:hypothetical protein